MWWKKNKWRVIVPVLVLAVLAAAFWYGGDSKGLHGWSVKESAAGTDGVSASAPVPDAAESPAEQSSAPDATVPQPEAEASAPAQTQTEAPAETSVPEVPDGSPSAAEETPAKTPTAPEALHCTVSVSCASVLDHMDWLSPDKTALIPENGWMLGSTEVAFTEGESVFDVLLRVCTEKKLHMEFTETPLYQSMYIEGIGNLYEFDCGELSGWMYSVNGWFPNYGCSRYTLSDGDTVRWVYTCELGDDVGGGYAAQ